MPGRQCAIAENMPDMHLSQKGLGVRQRIKPGTTGARRIPRDWCMYLTILQTTQQKSERSLKV